MHLIVFIHDLTIDTDIVVKHKVFFIKYEQQLIFNLALKM